MLSRLQAASSKSLGRVGLLISVNLRQNTVEKGEMRSSEKTYCSKSLLGHHRGSEPFIFITGANL